ncbi:MAG: FHA domain-containing protein [Oscillospiraceae bacterium]|nr:FHA domain-containing protein [Oscillospiraceae bacterium]
MMKKIFAVLLAVLIWPCAVRAETLPAEPGEDGDGYIIAGFAFLAGAALMISAGAIFKKKPKIFPVPKANFDNIGSTELAGGDKFQKERYAIGLGSTTDPSKTWMFPIEVDGGLLIGRAENCALRLEDRSVSREQCKIVAEDAQFFVVHLGVTNKTAVNGNIADKSVPLQIGDKIRFGREGLRVDYLQTPKKLPPDPMEPKDAGEGKTALLF